MHFLKCLGKNPSFPLLASGGSQQSFVFLGLWQRNSSLGLYLHMDFYPLCVLVSKFPCSYKDANHWIRVNQNPVWSHLNLITSAKTLCPNNDTFTNSRRTLILEGHCSTQYTAVETFWKNLNEFYQHGSSTRDTPGPLLWMKPWATGKVSREETPIGEARMVKYILVPPLLPDKYSYGGGK